MRSPLVAPASRRLLLLALGLAAASCADSRVVDPTVPAIPVPPGATRLAVIGDYGSSGAPERDVAALVRAWQPDWVATAGDNNYPDGSAGTIDRNIGQYYHDYIGAYAGGYGEGSVTNRFYPALGNHDWRAPGAQPYLDYFTLPGNERYYEVARGPLRLFVLDSDPEEPDGSSSTSTQAMWLHDRLAAAEEPWRVVCFHHAPYSSGSGHGSSSWMQWPFEKWGATAVVSGHDHHYERIDGGGTWYFVNGLGGAEKREIDTIVEGSVVRFTGDYGAMFVDATESSIVFRFVTRVGAVVDSLRVAAVGSLVPW